MGRERGGREVGRDGESSYEEPLLVTFDLSQRGIGNQAAARVYRVVGQ